jgi:N-acetylmuramoyl-L-alanine amidase
MGNPQSGYGDDLEQEEPQPGESLTVETADGTGNEKPVHHSTTLAAKRFEEFWTAYPKKVGKKAAEAIADNLKAIYPRPDFVTTFSNQTLNELKDVKAPAVLVEVGYHNNTSDAYWIRDNIDAIARFIDLGVSQYFGIPFVKPE